MRYGLPPRLYSLSLRNAHYIFFLPFLKVREHRLRSSNSSKTGKWATKISRGWCSFSLTWWESLLHIFDDYYWCFHMHYFQDLGTTQLGNFISYTCHYLYLYIFEYWPARSPRRTRQKPRSSSEFPWLALLIWFHAFSCFLFIIHFFAVIYLLQLKRG